VGYDITNFDVKIMRDFKIDKRYIFEEFIPNIKEINVGGWYKASTEHNRSYIHIGDYPFVFEGFVTDTVDIVKFGFYGEASGSQCERFFLKKFLTKTRGILVATLVWEQGQGFDVLLVKDGKVNIREGAIVPLEIAPPVEQWTEPLEIDK